MADSENKQWFEKDNASNKKKPNQGSNKKNSKNRRHDNRNNSNTNRSGVNRSNASNNVKPSSKNSNRPVQNGNRSVQNGNGSPAPRDNGRPNQNVKKRNDTNPNSNSSNTGIKTNVKKNSNGTRKLPVLFGRKKSKKAVADKKASSNFENVKQNKENTVLSEVKPTAPSFDKDKADKERKKRSRKTLFQKSLIAVALCLLLVAVLVFVVHHLFNYIAAKPELTFITSGSVEHTIGARALIVRDEVLVTGDTTGDLVTQATEGSRVYKNQRIGMVVPENMQTVVASLRNTQSQISDVQQELIQLGLAEGADDIYSDFDSGLNPIVDLIRLDAMDGNISGMSSYASSIAVLLNQRETTLATLDFDDERLRVLRSDEAAYENQLSRNATTIRATSPGVVSFRLDGLESTLNFNVLLEASSDSIYDYINGAVDVIPSDLTVQSGDPVARIASNEMQYIVCFLDERTANIDAFAVGKTHTINIGSEGISIGKCVVERVETTNHGLLVVFSTTRYVENLLDLRSVDIEVVINETTGLRVPISSLVNPDYDRNIATIYVNNQGFCDEVSVIIEDYDREFAIVAPIGDGSTPNLQTVIITNPSSIAPGEKVDN